MNPDLFEWREMLAEYATSSPVVRFLGAGTEGSIRACNFRMAELLEVPGAFRARPELWREIGAHGFAKEARQARR